MELLIPFLAYLGLLGGVVWYAARGSANAPILPNPPRERTTRVYTLGDQVLAGAAETLGIKHDVDVATGRVGELRVELAAEPDGTGPMKFSGVARFPRPLGLELSVNPRGVLGGRASKAIVSDDFDHVFRVDAIHADQARELLSGQAGELLMEGASRGLRVALDDDTLEVSIDATNGVERCTQALTWLGETGQAILAARARLKRPELEQKVMDAFEELAQSLGGRVDGDELRLGLEEGELTVHVDHVSGKRFRTQLGLVFERPLPIDLRLGLESERSRLERFRKKDIQLGDRAFDDVFVVMGDAEDEVGAALGEELRRRFLDLAEAVDGLALSSTEIEVLVDRALSDRDELGSLVAALREIARALAPRRAEGAYR